MIENIATLGMLVLLQAVLGFDNLLYLSLESKRAPEESRAKVRRTGILIAIALRIALLFVLIQVIKRVQDPVVFLSFDKIATGAFSIHSFIVLFGGVFIVYTAIKEIWHMLELEEQSHMKQEPASVRQVVTMIVIMNLVFSFDSILSAMALTDVFWVMACAIVIGGLLMLVLADHVSTFLEKNRAFEVMGLFILLIVGVMLLSEGGHLAHLHIFGAEITAMSKATFYFVIGVMVVVDLVQSKYQKNLLALKKKH